MPGKIVAMVFGAPGFPSAVKAHYSASWLKRRNAAEHGAVGALLLYDSRLPGLYPFEKQVRDLAIPRLNWLSATGVSDHYYPELRAYGARTITRRAPLHSPNVVARPEGSDPQPPSGSTLNSYHW